MKIFITWSGAQSHNVATALKDWLPYIFPGMELFVSSESIRKGKRWRAEISKELDTSNFGIACLTPDNLTAPWLLFESGALSKSVKEASLYTLLLARLRPADVDGPLSDFQHTTFEKEDFFKLVKSINEVNTPKVEEPRLRVMFDKFWGDLDDKVSSAIATVAKPPKSRSVEEMLIEVLDVTRQIARNLPEPKGLLEVIAANVTEAEQKNLWINILETMKRKFGVEPETVSALSKGVGHLSTDAYTVTFSNIMDHQRLSGSALKHLQETLTALGYAGLRVFAKVNVFAKVETPPTPPPKPKRGRGIVRPVGGRNSVES